MDPVNPAPAGNPQLTTHLLVSHKKNKNFHPSKVSLKRVKVIWKHVKIFNQAGPLNIYYSPNLSKKWVRCGRRFELTDITLKQLSKGSLFGTHVEHPPWKIHLKFKYDGIGILSQTDDNWNQIGCFINPTFLLKIFDWDGAELLKLSEKDVSIEILHKNLRRTIMCFGLQCSHGPAAIEAEYSWNGLKLKVGESEMHKAMDTQPFTFNSSGNLAKFLRKYQFFSRRFDCTIRSILQSVAENRETEAHGLFEPLQDETTRLSRYLKYLCDRARAVSLVSAEMLSLIRQMVERLVYYIEPMIVAIVDPVVDNPSQFTNSVLAIKMRDTFQKLCALKQQTAERLEEFLPSLESCLFCDWSEMLSLLISSNQSIFTRRLERLLELESILEVNKQLWSRFYVRNVKQLYQTMSGILESWDGDEVADETDPFSLACMTTKYQCWVYGSELGICYTPEHVTSPQKRSEFVIKIHLEFPEDPDFLQEDDFLLGSVFPKVHTLRSVNVCEDTLFIEGPKQLVYICNLSSLIQKGEMDQQLSQVSTSFQMRSEAHGMENDTKLQTISCFGRTSIANLDYKDGKNGALLRTTIYDLKDIAQSGSEGIKESQYHFTAEASVSERSISNVAFERLVNNLFAVGYFTHNNRSAALAPSIRLMLFQYTPSSSEMAMLTDNSFEIDQVRLARLPSYSDFDHPVRQEITFGTHRKRIFAILSLHKSKATAQIYCYHRKQFQLIGGTNCKTPGLYIMDNHNTVKFYNDPVYGGLCGIGCSPTIDHQMGMAHYKFGEYRLCF